MRELEFRLNLFLTVFGSFLWLGFALLSVELIFGQVDLIAGWSRNEIWLLMAVYLLFYDFFSIFISKNLREFSELIRRGHFDFVLLKPINTRFLVSTRYFNLYRLFRFVFEIHLLFKLLADFSLQPGLVSWLVFLALFCLGIIVFYNLFFSIAILSIWFVKLFNLGDLFSRILDAGHYPIDIFPKNFRLLFVYLIPIGFVATFSTQALLGQPNVWMISVGMVLSIITFILSHKFWHYALRHYQSASS